jgi:hypothetical protein
MQVMCENAGYKKSMTVININTGWRKKTHFWCQNLVFPRENGHALCVRDFIFFKFE